MTRWITAMLSVGILLILTVPGLCAQTKALDSTAESLCRRIPEIRRLPFKGEKSGDEVHDALIDAGQAAVPCLIGKVTDLRKMPDPRQAPTYVDVRVGDVAFFILVRISGLEFTAMLPQKVVSAYQRDGVYAYFRFVGRAGNRRWLQRRLENWYRQKARSTKLAQ